MEATKTKWLGLIAWVYQNRLFRVQVNKERHLLLFLHSLDGNLLDRLEFAFTARIHKEKNRQSLRYTKQPLSPEFSPEQELQQVVEATKMFGIGFNLDELKELRRICKDANKNEEIETDDLQKLQKFLGAIVKHSDIIMPG